MGEENYADMRQQHLSSTGDGLLHRHPFLPDELVFEILLRLSVKSLLQYKCVSKSWKTLISDPQFTETHLQNLIMDPTINHSRFFYSLNKDSCRITSIPVKPLFENLSDSAKAIEFSMKHEYLILGSYNGLLCLFSVNDGYVRLLNPSIEWKSKESPTLDCYEYEKDCIKYYGFGYDHVNGKYKMLAVLANEFGGKVTHIHTFGENSWTTIPNFPFPVGSFSCSGRFVSGTLNWVIVKTGVSPNRNVILSFDLAKESYKEVLLPKPDGVNVCNSALGILSNCLCVCFVSNKTHWDFWLMKKYGVSESWTRLTMIPLKKIGQCLQFQPSLIQPLFMFGNSSVLLRTDSSIFLFKLNNGRLDCIPGSFLYDYHIYHKSLVSPKF